LALVEYARTMLPVHEVLSDRKKQNEREGIPSDVVPINWTRLGQEMTGAKSVMVQSYLGCCFENLVFPLAQKAKELGVTELVLGQRLEEGHKSPARDGHIVDGIKRLHPIEDWTTEQVMSYLSTKMEIPAHFHIKHSSLDCFDCTAYRKDSQDRLAWTKARYPWLYDTYAARAVELDKALSSS
jgi:3'-phosphoadenosine 5'-phosphosulfate sulfotransferase (PAPS reductase)/FAD synthetase